MQVIVEGWRSNSSDWLKAQRLPAADLPSLTPEQKEVAGKLGISEEDYARSAKAGELSRHGLQAKAEAFGGSLETKTRDKRPDASIQAILLQTFDGKLRVIALVEGREVRFQIDEEWVDDLTQSGSPKLEERLPGIIALGLPAAEAKAA